MRNAVPRRLLLLCACSAAVHLALLDWIAGRVMAPRRAATAPGTTALSVRLMPSGAAAGTVALRAAPPGAAPPAAEAAPAAPAAPAVQRHDAVRAAPARAQPAARAAAAQDTPPATPASAAASGTPILQMPGRYRVQLPPSVLLTYALTRAAPGMPRAAAGSARIDWRTDGDRYSLEMDGVLGRLRSEGHGGDAGIVPRSAREERDGASLVTDFDAERHRVVFAATGTEAPDYLGMQDRASVLMQLAGIGLGEPDQVGDTLQVVVAGSADLRLARFEVLGSEPVETGIGTLAAWHLAERVGKDAPRLEIWLAPAQGWLPVQLRVTAPGGASSTQTLSAVAANGGPAP